MFPLVIPFPFEVAEMKEKKLVAKKYRFESRNESPKIRSYRAYRLKYATTRSKQLLLARMQPRVWDRARYKHREISREARKLTSRNRWLSSRRVCLTVNWSPTKASDSWLSRRAQRNIWQCWNWTIAPLSQMPASIIFYRRVTISSASSFTIVNWSPELAYVDSE